jgi:hypothetical protein
MFKKIIVFKRLTHQSFENNFFINKLANRKIGLESSKSLSRIFYFVTSIMVIPY